MEELDRVEVDCVRVWPGERGVGVLFVETFRRCRETIAGLARSSLTGSEAVELVEYLLEDDLVKPFIGLCILEGRGGGPMEPLTEPIEETLSGRPCDNVALRGFTVGSRLGEAIACSVEVSTERRPDWVSIGGGGGAAARRGLGIDSFVGFPGGRRSERVRAGSVVEEEDIEKRWLLL